MKFVWFTPFSTRSAIGRYSQLVTRELARDHEVEIWTFCKGSLLDTSVPVRTFESSDSLPISELRGADIRVYQLGNYWPFHGEILQQSFRDPGIVVLHDYSLHHLIALYFLEHLRDTEAYISMLRGGYGEPAAAEARRALQGYRSPLWETAEAVSYPTLSEAVGSALGVIAHSKYVMTAVRQTYSGPQLVLPLPYRLADTESQDLVDVPDDTLLIVTVGHVNPNKQVKAAIRALGLVSPLLRDRVFYAVLGPIEEWHKAELIREAEAAGVIRHIRFEGYVDDAKLRSFLLRADLCINLRSPNFEGASASAVEQMLAGKAIIANNTGAFAEFPSDVIRTVDGPAALAASLELLLSNDDLRMKMGTRAREYAEKTFRADTYAQELGRFAQHVLHQAPLTMLENSLKNRFAEWGLQPNNPWAKRIHTQAHQLLT
jgi:glycosyltransferase involved in cell wall biosynthesis